MSDKVRGALFNALGDIVGLTVLDAFAGSGALSIEAISRGAATSVAIDIDKSANTAIINNFKQLRITDKIKVIRANASSWSDNNPDAKFDLVLLDPPYDSIQVSVIEKLVNHAKTGGTIVISLPPKTEISLDTSYQILATNNYGDATLAFYRRIS
jgi:16S rRNA (guanine966-N2)-methyltransferase